MNEAGALAGLTAAVFVAAFLQATSGFGFALAAMPLVTLALGLQEAVPLVAVLALLITFANSVRLRRHIERRELAALVGSALLGVPLGFWLFAHAPEAAVRISLGLVLIAYAVYAWLRPAHLPQPRAGWALPAGFVAGALGAAYNVPGPPVIVYGDLRAWPRDCYRATLQAFFFINGLLVVGGHTMLGRYDRRIGMLLLVAFPALVLGNVAGVMADRWIDPRRFRRLVLGLILATGILLLF